jgi:phosphoserine phosphatase
VTDCPADPRFEAELDLGGARSLLSLPLVSHEDELIGVLQIVNCSHGRFDRHDEHVASALAAQCAVVLYRAQMTETRLLTEKLDREITVAREIQMSGLPEAMPQVEGYDGAGLLRPTDQTGGDLFDFVRLPDGRLFLLLGDATGHGIGPALSATQLRAMVRVGLRLGAGLDEIYQHVNNQLVADLPADRFVTAFLGILEPDTHAVSFHAGGQGPLLHFRAATATIEWHGPSSFPMGVLAQSELQPSRRLTLEPGDVLGLISDGIYEYENSSGEHFGEERVAAVMREHHHRPMQELAQTLLSAARQFGGAALQADDITIVLLRRLADSPAKVSANFHRSFAALGGLFEFTRRFYDRERIATDDRLALDFCIEEIFTNFVKYHEGNPNDIELELERHGSRLTARLTDFDVERFDVTQVPPLDTEQPIEAREPGGLGLHIVRRMAHELAYDYTNRRTRITVTRDTG